LSLTPDGDGSDGSLVSTMERLPETSRILKYQWYRPWYGGNANPSWANTLPTMFEYLLPHTHSSPRWHPMSIVEARLVPFH
jgi:hypothetical protein